MVTAAPHPAKYTDGFLPIFAEEVRQCRRLLDFNAGTCKIVRIRDHGYTGEIVCVEMEPEWAEYGRDNHCTVLVANAEHMPFLDGYFDGAVVSVCYANRMADHHNARDNSRRNTYRHQLGRPLTEGNAGGMQWGPEYQRSYTGQYTELRRVLREGATFVLNVSNHIRKGQEVPVTEWHIGVLKGLGFELVRHREMPTPRNRFGANGALRVDHESILVFKLHKAASGEEGR